ncbi:MAG TPA: PaaI family thioesterase [Acidimicrobiales bacterium]
MHDLNDAVRALIQRVRTLDAADDVVKAATAAIGAVVESLEPYTYGGPYQQAQLRMSEGGRPSLVGEEPAEFFPYSPVVGPLNPLSPPVRMRFDGERMHGNVTFGAPYAGPPATVHGGVIALVFDELLGALNVMHDLGGFTGTLSIRYERPTPLGVPLELEAWIDRTEGRKVFPVGVLRHEGTVTARAEGVFIRSTQLPSGREQR